MALVMSPEPMAPQAIPSPEDDSVTAWLRQLTEGDPDAAGPLWREYFHRMVELARRRLPDHRRASSDEEDIALSAFKSFCLGMQEGKFPQLVGRDTLWPLLVAITTHKAQDLMRREGRLKRGGNSRKVGEFDWHNALGEGASPEVEAILAEQMERFFAELESAHDPEFVPMIQASLAGDTPAEIAGRFGCSVRTVQRKLSMARAILERSDEDEPV